MTDSPVLMAAKAQMRNQRPLVLAISTNDGLGLNAANIAKLLVAKYVYFVPFGQDDPMKTKLVSCQNGADSGGLLERVRRQATAADDCGARSAGLRIRFQGNNGYALGETKKGTRQRKSWGTIAVLYSYL